MPFLHSIAGPSRLPAHILPVHLPLSVSFVRSYASRPLRRPDFREDADGKSRTKMGSNSASLLQERDAEYGFQHWLLDYGPEFAEPATGEKARWLGDTVPYPGNPSFRPPPPLSNDLQEKLYEKLTKTGKTVGQIAQEDNVSKARIEAVRKLKEVEAEFRRQNKPLQYAFLNSMEPLLGVQSIKDRNTKRISETLLREEKTLRETHPSSVAEQVEEQRYEAGLGDAGAFGKALSERMTKGIEKAAWEFRSEEEVSLEAPTPMTDAAEEYIPLAEIEEKNHPSTLKPSPRTAFRFVDVSSIKPSWELRKSEEARSQRHKRKVKK